MTPERNTHVRIVYVPTIAAWGCELQRWLSGLRACGRSGAHRGDVGISKLYRLFLNPIGPNAHRDLLSASSGDEQ